jgi:hypothetical protein
MSLAQQEVEKKMKKKLEKVSTFFDKKINEIHTSKSKSCSKS